MATTFEQTTAEEALTLEEKVAASCGLSLAEAEKEIDCAADNLRAGIEDDSLNYDNVLDELAGLGLDDDFDNIEALVWRMFC